MITKILNIQHRYRKTSLFVVAPGLIIFSFLILSLVHESRVYADCYVNSSGASNGTCVDPSADISDYGSQCVTNAGGGISGYAYFAPLSVVVNPNTSTTTPIELGSYDCQGSSATGVETYDDVAFENAVITSFNGAAVSGGSNILQFSSPGYNVQSCSDVSPGSTATCYVHNQDCSSSPPDAPFGFILPAGSCPTVYSNYNHGTLGNGQWTYEETSVSLINSDFTNSGTYGITLSGGALVCSTNTNPASCGQTNITQTPATLYITVVGPPPPPPPPSKAAGKFTLVCQSDGTGTAKITGAKDDEGNLTGGWLFIGSLAPGGFGDVQPPGFNASNGVPFTIPAADLLVPHSVYLFVNDPGGSYTYIANADKSAADQLTPVCSTPPPTVTCGSFTGTQGGVSIDANGDIQPGVPFSFNVGAAFSGGTTPSYPTYDFTTSVTSGSPSAFSPAIPGGQRSFTVSGSTIKSVAYGSTISAAGVYTLTWYFNQGASPLTSACSQTLTVGNDPYVSVNGGDVMAGSPIGLDSSIGIGAGILTYNNNGSPNYQGSGDNLAAYAVDLINQFVTDFSTTPAPGYTLSFANASPRAGPNGGGFGYAFTGPDLYAQAASIFNMPNPTNTSTGVVLGSITPTTPGCKLSNGTTYCWYSPANQAVPISQGSLPTSKIVVFVKGDVELTSNIGLSDSGWLGVNNLPSLYIVSEGNIYIDNSVTSLRGVYSAEPSAPPAIPGHPAANGDIFTCVDPGASGTDPTFYGPTVAPTLYGSCSSALSVTGAFVANQVRFERTAGTVGSGTAAESFTYDPAIWMDSPFVTNTQPNVPIYTSTTALPPVL